MPTAPPPQSVGFTGKGGSLSISSDGTTFTPVDQIQKVSSSGQKANLADITNINSPNAFIERIPTTLDSGTVSFTVVSNPADAGQLMLLAAFNAQTKLTCKLQYPLVGTQTSAGLLKTFSAYVTSAPMPSLAVTEASTFDAELTITGPVADTPGS
jgi:Lambda phage tail tube protein, TTP